MTRSQLPRPISCLALVLALVLVLVSLASAPMSTQAAGLGVAPLRVDLGPDQTVGTLTVRNEGVSPTLVQVQSFAWTRTTANEDLDPTRDVLAVPALATIAPGRQQVVRVALRKRPDGRREAAYRLLIAEVPRTDESGGAGVHIALAFSIPVFVTPQGALPKPAWSIVKHPQGSALRLVNAGQAHLKVDSVRLGAGPGATRIDQPAYVLPGQEHLWPLGVRWRPTGDTVPLAADTDRGAIEAVVPPPGG